MKNTSCPPPPEHTCFLWYKSADGWISMNIWVKLNSYFFTNPIHLYIKLTCHTVCQDLHTIPQYLNVKCYAQTFNAYEHAGTSIVNSNFPWETYHRRAWSTFRLIGGNFFSKKKITNLGHQKCLRLVVGNIFKNKILILDNLSRKSNDQDINLVCPECYALYYKN